MSDQVTEWEARQAMAQLVWEDGHSKCLSVSGARQVEILRLWFNLPLYHQTGPYAVPTTPQGTSGVKLGPPG